ncbi:MAG: hypothetical protein ACRDKG_10860 [Actinomycetota bacterium]
MSTYPDTNHSTRVHHSFKVGGQTVARIGPGRLFAAEDSTILPIDKQRFDHLIGDTPIDFP